MERKAPIPQGTRALARRAERDRRERRADQRNTPRPIPGRVELGSLLSFPPSDPPDWVTRRKR